MAGTPPDSRELVRAAGGIVLRAAHSGGWETAIIHRPERADWTLPKGKLEPGETIEEAALREVLEETGYHCALGRFVGDVHYEDRRGRPKVVSYFLMQPVEGQFQPSAEVDELVWLPLNQAAVQLSYEHDRDLLTAASAGSASHFE